jgi:hypothetical protein
MQRGKSMKPRSIVLFLATGLLTIPFFWLSTPDAAGEQRGARQAGVEKGIYIELTQDFYRALESESDAGNKVYGDRKSDEYLRQIAVSAKFMVETNLKLLEMQERIIDLLEKAQVKGMH